MYVTYQYEEYDLDENQQQKSQDDEGANDDESQGIDGDGKDSVCVCALCADKRGNMMDLHMYSGTSIYCEPPRDQLFLLLFVLKIRAVGYGHMCQLSHNCPIRNCLRTSQNTMTSITL